MSQSAPIVRGRRAPAPATNRDNQCAQSGFLMVLLNSQDRAPLHFSSIRKTLKKAVINAQDPRCSPHLTPDQGVRDSSARRRYGLLVAFDRLTTGERHGKVCIGLDPWSARNGVGGYLPDHASLSAASDCALIFDPAGRRRTMATSVAGRPDSASCRDLDSPGQSRLVTGERLPAICSRC